MPRHRFPSLPLLRHICHINSAALLNIVNALYQDPAGPLGMFGGFSGSKALPSTVVKIVACNNISHMFVLEVPKLMLLKAFSIQTPGSGVSTFVRS